MPSVPAAHDQPCATALGLEEELPHPVGVIAAMEPLQIAGGDEHERATRADVGDVVARPPAVTARRRYQDLVRRRALLPILASGSGRCTEKS